MNISNIIYHNVQESFGMGGPYIGNLEFKGQYLDGLFLADNETLSGDRTKILFSWFKGVSKK